jgi:2-dehydro-3-deoxy-L-rhamnonate aldolase
MIDQTWKDRLQTEPLLGCFVTFASPAICEFTAEIGFDFTLIDNEHGLMNDETLENMVRASQAADCPSIVRIPFNQPDYIRRALDFGANGIQVPLVNDVADAHKVVKASHFPPFGERGVAFQTRPARYGMVRDKAAYLRDADRAKLVAVHVETVEAVDRLDALLEVEGIDVYFVGPGDLAVSMGYPHDLNHPDVLGVVDKTIGRIRDRGRIAGTYVGDATRGRQVIEAGAHFVVTILTPHMVRGGQEFLGALR